MKISYHVVAMSMPIVYNFEGDHDPDGKLFTLKAHWHLLNWARDRWNDDLDDDHDYGGGDDPQPRLPRLHFARQRAQLVVDGLPRLEIMLGRLHEGGDEERQLIAELIRHEHRLGRCRSDEKCGRCHRRHRGSDRIHAIRTNLHHTVDELRTALTDLGATHGLLDWADPPPEDGPDEPVEDTVVEEPPFRLVTLSTTQRTAWRAHWTTQLEALDRAIARALDLVRARFAADVATLVADSGIPRAEIERMLFNDHTVDVRPLGIDAPDYDRFNPLRPIPLVQPLVLRAHLDEEITVKVENRIRGRRLGFHVQGDGLSATTNGVRRHGVRHADGSHVAGNPDSTIGEYRSNTGATGPTRTFHYAARHEGVWPINDLADVRGGEQGTNVHGLFGALIVEPKGVSWRDPETGADLTGRPYGRGLYVDIHYPAAEEPTGTDKHRDFIDFYSDSIKRSHREFTVFMHDEPETRTGLNTVGMHSAMPISYRSEPMINRLPHRMRRYAERTPPKPPPGQTELDRNAVLWTLGEEFDEEFWTARTPDGRWLERVAGEEQHHSSWLFGEPATPVLRAYKGDPCRVRLVHAGVKETHVFHLHVHQWRAWAPDTAVPSVWGVDAGGKPKPKGSQLIDSITIGPQTAMTIDPLYGSGSRQHAPGDIIWHCHLYPHFHHGMWGLWRSYDRAVDGTLAYPDGTPCAPLPGRDPLLPDAEHPGFPWFIDGDFPMKAPPPPAAIPEHRHGRRILLGMADSTPRERAAMASDAVRAGASPGALFVDLDQRAAEWNAAAKLPPPRIVSYDLEVLADQIDYNSDGWHDPRGHRYRLLAVAIKVPDGHGGHQVLAQHDFETATGADPDGSRPNPEPIYPRANHGDIVEWRMHNALPSFPADQIDFGQLPVECGLHVHLVKFDVLAADGSSTGWNYLSGASAREAVGADQPGQQRTVGLHRWVVDEEFGPCFFHDHLLANYRQKHGLFAALIAEPHGSQWLRAADQSVTAWGDADAVIVPPKKAGLPPQQPLGVPPFREGCLAIGDFVPLLDRGGRAINPPSELSGVDDPGVMAISYRSSPMRHRDKDPSLWFSTEARSKENLLGVPGEPDTPLVRGYPGERLRIRLIQGSHEEGHNFGLHGLRWRRDWGNPRAPLVNQQSIGISEAFTLDIDPRDASPYGVGDHLYLLNALDDIWLGCWGYVRIHRPGPDEFAQLAPLPDLDNDPAAALARMRTSRATPLRPVADHNGAYPSTVRTYVVVARRYEHHYAGRHLTDPWGLVYQVVDYDQADYDQARSSKDGRWPAIDVAALPAPDGPLVLRAKPGEWVRVILVNEILRKDRDLPASLPRFGPELSAPLLFEEHHDECDRPDRRTVSPQVSLHPSLLCFDVTHSDGANVGHNQDGTVAPWTMHLGGGMGGDHEGGAVVFRADHAHNRENWRELWWFADDKLAPAQHTDGPGQVCYLQDMADIRNHRHHGLVGALVVEPGDVQPFRPGSNAAVPDGFVGREAELRRRKRGKWELVAREGVVFFQDGLRLFVNGNPGLPVPDVPLEDEHEVDSGQKGISYRSALVHRGRPPTGGRAEPPLITADEGDTVWLRVLGGGDKLRQHTLTVHGVAWRAAPWLKGRSPWSNSASGVVGGWAEDLAFQVEHHGDHAIRTGAFRWGTELGVWATLRVQP